MRHAIRTHRIDEGQISGVSKESRGYRVSGDDRHAQCTGERPFQVITEHVYDPTYLNIQRTEDMMFIQLFLNEGRTVDVKERFRGRLSTY